MEDELSVYEDKIALRMIEENEEEREKQKEDERKQNIMRIEQERQRQYEEERMKRQQDLLKKRGELSIYEREINKLLNVMMIKDPNKILETYQNM